MATAINIYLKKLGREKRIPFDVSVDPFYSPKICAKDCENRLHRWKILVELCMRVPEND